MVGLASRVEGVLGLGVLRAGRDLDGCVRSLPQNVEKRMGPSSPSTKFILGYVLANRGAPDRLLQPLASPCCVPDSRVGEAAGVVWEDATRARADRF